MWASFRLLWKQFRWDRKEENEDPKSLVVSLGSCSFTPSPIRHHYFTTSLLSATICSYFNPISYASGHFPETQFRLFIWRRRKQVELLIVNYFFNSSVVERHRMRFLEDGSTRDCSAQTDEDTLSERVKVLDDIAWTGLGLSAVEQIDRVLEEVEELRISPALWSYWLQKIKFINSSCH